MRKKLVNIKTERLLRDYKPLRNSDKLLLLAYWASEGLHLTKEQRDIFVSCTPAESITRARRILRAKYPGDKGVEEARYEKMKEAQDQYSNLTPEQKLARQGYKIVE